MKKFFFLAVLLFGASILLKAQNFDETKLHKDELFKKYVYDGNYNNGSCHVHYHIEIDYSILPPRINSVHGYFKTSGCNGTYNFRLTGEPAAEEHEYPFDSNVEVDGKGIIKNVEYGLDYTLFETEEFKKYFLETLNGLHLFKE